MREEEADKRSWGRDGIGRKRKRPPPAAKPRPPAKLWARPRVAGYDLSDHVVGRAEKTRLCVIRPARLAHGPGVRSSVCLHFFFLGSINPFCIYTVEHT